MKTPDHWSKRNFTSEALVLVSVFYFIFLRLKYLFCKKGEKLSVPVICVGNITAGGAGKTPTAIAIAKILKSKHKKPAFVSRGYGGSIKQATKVDIENHTSKQVGDEPLILVQTAPCYIAANRVDAANLAIKEGADIIILDDGMQNPSIKKDLSINVIDGGFGFGNELLIPAGPLRDKKKIALSKADISIIIGDDKKSIEENLPEGMRVFHAEISPSNKKKPSKKVNYIAFAGIGRPGKFFESLGREGLKIVQRISLPDHYNYNKNDLIELENLAKDNDAKLITTQKDAIKLPEEFKKQIFIFNIAVKFDDEKSIKNIIKEFTGI